MLRRTWLAMIMLALSPWLQALEITPYTASYRFNLDNKLSGTATRTLERRGDDLWRYTFAASAPVATATEISDFRFDGRTVTPLGYSQERKILFSQRKSRVQFNWKKGTGTGSREGKPSVEYRLQPGTLDALNLEIQIRRDLQDLGKLGGPYALASPKEIAPLLFTIEGEETLVTPFGKLRTLKVSKKHNDPQRHTTFWLARDHAHLPAKVVQRDEGALYTIELTSLKLAK